METERKILFNTFALTVGHGIAQLANLAFVIYFARVFGADKLGEYSFAMAIGGLVSIFTSFGTISLAVKQITQAPITEQKLLGALMPMLGVAGILVIVTTIVLGQFLDISSEAYAMLVTIGIYHVALNWTSLIGTRYHARELMAYVAGVDAIQNILRLLFGVSLIWLFKEPIVAIGAFPVCAIAALTWLFVAAAGRFGSISFSVNVGTAKTLIVQAWPYFSLVLLNVLYARLGIVYLTIMKPEAAVGYFASAERLVVAAGLLHSMFLGAVLPSMTRLAAHNPKATENLAARSLRLLLIVTLPAATLLHLLSNDIIRQLYGAGFEPSVIVLEIVSWSLVLRGLCGYFSVLAIANDLQKELSKIRLVSLIVLVALAVPLVYMMSYVGLAYAMVGADTFLATMMYFQLRHKVTGIRLVNAMWRTGLACGSLFLVQVLFAEQSTVIRFTALPAILLATLVLVGAVRSQDLKYLRRIAASRPGD